MSTSQALAPAAMNESVLAEFCELIRSGAATQDIFDASSQQGYALTHGGVRDQTVQREVERVRLHQRSLCPILERYVGPIDRALDVGCSSGGTTVAVALSPIAKDAEIIGVDPNVLALQAARVRARGYGLDAKRVRFETIVPGARLPYDDNHFQLVICASVIEFISSGEARKNLAAEIMRVTRPGGYAYVTLPNPHRIREYHSGRIFGNYRRRDGFPWASRRSALRQMFGGCELISLQDHLLDKVRDRLGNWVPGWTATVLPHVARWQKLLFKKTR